MIRQRKISKNLGRDTYVRSIGNNAFTGQSVNTHEIISGEIALTQIEPLYRQNAVSVNLTRGGRLDGVGYPGAFIDPVSGNLHGSYEGPIPGQMVNIGFLNGNSAAPIVLNRYPYQGVGNTLYESSYITPMYKYGYDASDVLLGHFSGSVIGLYTGINPAGGRIPGSIGIDAITECNITAMTNILLDAMVSAEVKSALVKINGATRIELNGNTKQFVTWTELNSKLQTMLSAINAELLLANGVGTAPGTATGSTTLDISDSKTTTVVTGG